MNIALVYNASKYQSLAIQTHTNETENVTFQVEF